MNPDNTHSSKGDLRAELSPFAAMVALARLVLLLAIMLPAMAASQSLASIEPPMPAPSVTLTRIDGQQYAMESFTDDVLVINFWASWCPPCLAELPSLQRLHQAHQADGLQVLLINVSESNATVEQFLKSQTPPLNLPVFLDLDAQLMVQFGARALPTTLIVDRKGRIRYRAIGDRDWFSESIKSLILELL